MDEAKDGEYFSRPAYRKMLLSTCTGPSPVEGSHNQPGCLNHITLAVLAVLEARVSLHSG